MIKMENVISRESSIFIELISKIKKMESKVEIMREGKMSCVEKWLNGEHVMKKLWISKRTLQAYRDNRILPYSSIGGKFYYRIGDIEDLMMKNYVSAEIQVKR